MSMTESPESDEEREAKWKAESDARTITEAAVVTADPERLKRAQEAAKRMAEEESARNKAMADLGDGKWPMDYTKTLEKK